MTERFAYTGVGTSGSRVADIVQAESREAALRALEREGIAVLSIGPMQQQRKNTFGARRIRSDERVIVVRQLATMTGAGVALLEALEAVAESLAERPIGEGVRAFAGALRRGAPIEDAFRTGLPGYPDYVYALAAAGAASGRLPAVLEEAAQHLAFEATLRRELAGALAYPTVLVSAAIAVFLFLFSTVVPRFVDMVGDRRRDLDGVGRAVLDLGALFADSPALAFALVLGLPAAVAATAATGRGRAALARLAGRMPGIRELALARARGMWARVMSFSIGAGVGMAAAADLAAASAAPGAFKDAMLRGNRAIRVGKPVHDAFGVEPAFDPIDRSLMSAAERSGAYAAMLSVVAERHEDAFRRRVKLLVTFIEQAAIAFVAIAIGAVVISLVTAITTLYDTIGA